MVCKSPFPWSIVSFSLLEEYISTRTHSVDDIQLGNAARRCLSEHRNVIRRFLSSMDFNGTAVLPMSARLSRSPLIHEHVLIIFINLLIILLNYVIFVNFYVKLIDYND